MPLLVVLLIVIAIIVAGAAIIGLALNLLWYAIIGLVIGMLARMIVPKSRNVGLLATILYGLAGAFLGGILADILDVGSILSLVLSVLVAGILVSVFSSGARKA